MFQLERTADKTPSKFESSHSCTKRLKPEGAEPLAAENKPA